MSGEGVLNLVAQVSLGSNEGLIKVHIHGARNGAEQQRSGEPDVPYVDATTV